MYVIRIDMAIGLVRKYCMRLLTKLTHTQYRRLSSRRHYCHQRARTAIASAHTKIILAHLSDQHTVTSNNSTEHKHTYSRAYTSHGPIPYTANKT